MALSTAPMKTMGVSVVKKILKFFLCKFQFIINFRRHSDASYKGVTVYAPSHECKMLGGLCVLEGDCEKDNTVHKRGLCPDRDIGVECCYEVIPRSAPCQTFGGLCMDECGVTVQQTLVNDCGDKKCCIQVNLIN